MGKFIIQCPQCGRANQAKTGWFAKKQVECLCGYSINVKTEKLASYVCNSCGNNIVFDQSKGQPSVCPICKKNISNNSASVVHFSCPTCGCSLSADQNSGTCTCPLCDASINVQEMRKKEEIKKSNTAVLLKYEGDNNTLIWKHPIQDMNYGSQIVVHESQEAVFIKDGVIQGFLKSGRHKLDLSIAPIIAEFGKLAARNEKTFHSEVYFVNTATITEIKWGTDSKVTIKDPEFDIPFGFGACGSFNIKISDSKKFLLSVVGTTSAFSKSEIVGSSEFGISLISGKFRSLVINNVKNNLAKAVKDNNISIFEMDSKLDVISGVMKHNLNAAFDEYGLEVTEFFVTNISTPDDDPNFKKLKNQFAEKVLRVREEEIKLAEAKAAREREVFETQTGFQTKIIGAQGDAEVLKIMAEAQAAAHRMKVAAETEEMRAKGYTYDEETARLVALEAMKNGLTGTASSEIANLGVSVGVANGVSAITQKAISPETHQQAPNNTPKTWSCGCGNSGITSKFCPNCGAKCPEDEAWTCANCGKTGITFNFCPDCGAKRP